MRQSCDASPFNAADAERGISKDAVAKLAWSKPEPKRVRLSDASEQPLTGAPEAIKVPAWGVVTLRADLP